MKFKKPKFSQIFHILFLLFIGFGSFHLLACVQFIASYAEETDFGVNSTHYKLMPLPLKPHESSWFSNLKPLTSWQRISRQASRIVDFPNLTKADETFSGMTYYHGFNDFDHYGKVLSEGEIIYMMMITGHPSRKLIARVESKSQQLFQDSSFEIRKNEMGHMYREHFSELESSVFDRIRDHLTSHGTDENFRSNYLSGATNIGICTSFCFGKINPNSLPSFGYLIELKPNPHSISLTNLEKASWRIPKRGIDVPLETHNPLRPLSRFVARNSEATHEIIDIVYFPEQIQKVLQFDDLKKVIKVFEKISADNLLVKNYQTKVQTLFHFNISR